MSGNLFKQSRGPRGALTTVILAIAVSLAAEAGARGAPESFADLAERLLPAVVNISTTQTVRGQRGPEMPQVPPGSPFEDWFKEFFDRRQGPDAPTRRATSLGSGFIIDPSGYVVTNNHVIEGADEIRITLHDDTTYDAVVQGRDTKTDLALLKVEADVDLPFVTFGDSDITRVGDWVVAIGNPFGLGGTVTAGIVSARSRDINAGPYDDFIQTDASINRGNSGGPMFNLDGEVIGVNTAIYSPSGGSVGIGFAIPSAQVGLVIAQLKEFGRTRRGWLGVHIQTVTDEIAEGLGLDSARGALVASIGEDSPAAVGSIEQGDVILEFDGRAIERMRQLAPIVADTRIGRDVAVVVWRKGQEIELIVVVGELEEAQVAAVPSDGGGQGEPEETTLDELGLSLATITDELRDRYDLSADTTGVVVTAVMQNSPAAEKGITAGDVIIEIGQERVLSPSQIGAKVAEAQSAGRRSVLLLVEQGGRRGQPAFMALRIDRG